jgi:catechol 2,3-dioxygenase-like lactoylglutathione lyase family enzyme
MKVERIDHIHVKVKDQPKATGLYEQVLGTKMLMEADFTDGYGMRVAYNPFPIGLELMEVTNTSNELGKIYAAEPDGVFALSLKVPDIEQATADMESMGHKLLMRYDFGEIKEALFDSKKTVGVYIELIEYAGENITDADNGGVGESGKVTARTS